MGSIRIIAGRLRGRKLEVPEVDGLRPTGSRVREALFNILGQDLTGRPVLDLYAGTGALGFEALSRGSPRVVFVESRRDLATALRRSAERLGVAGSVGVVASRVEDVVSTGTLRGPFDVILADPPYREVDPLDLAARIDRAHLLTPAGILVVESGSIPIPGPEPSLRLTRSERYGSTFLLFFKYQNSTRSVEES